MNGRRAKALRKQAVAATVGAPMGALELVPHTRRTNPVRDASGEVTHHYVTVTLAHAAGTTRSVLKALKRTTA